jgi:hypothetical protein
MVTLIVAHASYDLYTSLIYFRYQPDDDSTVSKHVDGLSLIYKSCVLMAGLLTSYLLFIIICTSVLCSVEA